MTRDKLGGRRCCKRLRRISRIVARRPHPVALAPRVRSPDVSGLVGQKKRRPGRLLPAGPAASRGTDFVPLTQLTFADATLLIRDFRLRYSAQRAIPVGDPVGRSERAGAGAL